MKKLLVLCLCFIAFSISYAQVDVTATGGTLAASYTTLKGAFDAINSGTHTGTITIGISGDATETAPAVLNASGSGSASYTTITISPTGGSARIISGAIAAGSPLIDFNGADNVTIDGLNTGGNSLTFSNTTASATSGTSTIRFIGGATNNVITNCSVLGSFSAAVATNGGNIFFSTDGVTASGNDNNTISLCNIGPAGANLPTKGIYGNGSTTTAAIGNSGIIINNNNIYDFFSATVTSAGIYTNGGCNTWSITNNKFYQTATRTWTTGLQQHSPIWITPSTGTSGAQGFTITGNIIGYASNTQTGTYTLTGSTGKFIGIFYNGITLSAPTTISSNTVASVSMTGVTSSGTSTSSPFMAIYVANGLTVTNSNIIGSQSVTGSLVFSTTTTSATDVYGFYNFSVDTWTSNSNNIGGISVTNAGASGTFLVYGMRANTGTSVGWTATSNNIGGTVANSIQLSATGTSSQVVGMLTGNAPASFASNTIRNLTTNIGTGTTTAASVIGINITTSTPNHILSQNTIYNLSNTNATAASVVTGIQFTGGTANVVERNFIYGLTVATTSTAAEVNGIRVAGGTTIYRNNMIALGAGIANAIGTGSTTGGINGINEPLGTDQFFHNSVYIGGSPSAGVGPSYAFNSSQTVNTRSFRDNIFFNARSNSGATGKNYIVRVGGTAPNPTGLTINNNVYYANGTGAVFGFFNSLDVANLAAWKTAVGQDAGSFEVNPEYADPTNALPDLHLHPTNATVAEGNGVDVGVTNDFDGQTRSGLTPVDIGADAGNYNGIDLAGPSITYTTLGNTSSTSNRTLVSVTITDVTGVPTSGALQPRLWFKRSIDVPWVSTQGVLQTGSGTNGVWDFTIDYSQIPIIPAAGETYQYYVVAQDIVGTPNISTNPSGGVHTDVNTQSSAPATPNSYLIVPAFTGPINVGTGETYTSLTNTGGIFEAINGGALTGNVTLNITTDLTTELGTVALNQWAEDGIGGYTMLIKPSGAPRTVTGSNTGALIKLNGADRVTIDGSTSGASAAACLVGGDASIRELTIQNTNTGTSAVVISVQTGTNGAQNNTIKNVNVIGQDPTTTLLGIGLGGNTPGTVGTDNDNNRIENCSIKRAIYGIYSAGASLANQNTGTVFTQNDLSATTSDRIRRVGILIFNDDGVQVTYNSVGGVETNESADAVGIGIGNQGVDATTTTAGGVSNALVSNNKINGVASLSTVGFSAAGITVAGSNTGANVLRNNVISGVTAPSTSPDLVAGIFIVGATGSDTRLYYNSVSMTGDRGAVASQMPSYGIAITGSNPIVELKNNVFYTSQIASGGGVDAKSYAIGMVSTTFTNLNSNYNNFWSIGANDGGFRTGSLSAASGTSYATIALWRTAISGDGNSWEGDPGFTLPASNLLPDVTNPNSWTLNGKGVQIASVNSDHLCNSRSTTVPTGSTDIGAFEFTPTVVPPLATASGAPANSTTTTYSFAGRQLASIDWGAGGTVPSSVDFQYFSGTWPTGAMGNYANAYYSVTVPDGSGYGYDITFNYDPAIIGTIPSEGLMKIGKYDGTWVPYAGSTVNTIAKTVTLTGLSSFSLFTFYDENTPLPIELNTFTAKAKDRTIILSWETKTEVNSSLFGIERMKENTNEWLNVGIVQAAGNSNSPVSYSFTDNKLQSGKFSYRLKMIDANGSYRYSDAVEAEVGLPTEYAISQNYPNPFNPTTRIDYQLPFDSRVTLELYGITGEKVATLINTELSAGYYTADVNASALNLASGIYIYRMVASGGNNQSFTQVKKLMLTK